MNRRRVLLPPEIVQVNEPIIFLNGPVQGAPNWQPVAADMLHDIDDSILIASPRKDYEPGTFDHSRQVDWETAMRRQTRKLGVQVFWLVNQLEPTPERSYAQTSRFELSESKRDYELYQNYHDRIPELDRAKMIVGIEPGFGNERYYRQRFGQEAPGVLIVDNLEALCINAINLLRD